MLTPEQVVEADAKLDAALRRWADPAEAARRAADPAYHQHVLLQIANLCLLIRDAIRRKAPSVTLDTRFWRRVPEPRNPEAC